MQCSVLWQKHIQININLMFSTWDNFATIKGTQSTKFDIILYRKLSHFTRSWRFFTRQLWLKLWRKFWWKAFPTRIKCFISIQNHNTYRVANKHIIPFQGNMFQQSNSWNELWEIFCRISFLQVIASVERCFLYTLFMDVSIYKCPCCLLILKWGEL